MKDLLGKAMFDYQTNATLGVLYTETDISEQDEMDIPYLFRDYEQMPKIEQKALDLCFGKILDVGCGAGSHSLYLQSKSLDVKAIDISPKAVEVAKLRGVVNVEKTELLSENGKYDTILMLMNGSGIFQKLENITQYLVHLKSLLNEKGQILIDSSDLIYMFDQDEDGGVWITAEKDYYGELTFEVSYKNEKETFDWLYLDYNTLQNACIANGLTCELILEGDNYDYLAKITL